MDRRQPPRHDDPGARGARYRTGLALLLATLAGFAAGWLLGAWLG